MQLLPGTKTSAFGRHACAGALLDLLPGLMRFVRRQMRSRRAAGLSVPQFRTLVQLHRRPATSLSVVAEALGATAPNTSRIVSGLVRKGFIARREALEDRRQVSLQLTPKGEQAMQTAWSGTQKALAEQLAELSEAQLQELGAVLGVLATFFGPLVQGAEKTKPDTAKSRPPRCRRPATAVSR